LSRHDGGTANTDMNVGLCGLPDLICRGLRAVLLSLASLWPCLAPLTLCSSVFSWETSAAFGFVAPN
jgi:hypothetical protein